VETVWLASEYQKSHRNQKFVRRYSHDRSERSDQSPPKVSNALYVTALDDRICSTYVLENVQVTRLHDTFDKITDAGKVVERHRRSSLTEN
jgi:hypothetical protein